MKTLVLDEPLETGTPKRDRDPEAITSITMLIRPLLGGSAVGLSGVRGQSAVPLAEMDTVVVVVFVRMLLSAVKVAQV